MAPPPFSGGRIIQLTNCRVLREDALAKQDLWIQDGRFIDAQKHFYAHRRSADVKINCDGLIVAPGFIDLDVGGSFGVDFSSTPESVSAILPFLSLDLLAHGVTAYVATIRSTSPAAYRRLLPVFSAARKSPGSPQAAELLGVHLDGPFVSVTNGFPEKAPVTSLEKGLVSLYDVYGGSLEDVRVVTLAPEVSGAMGIIPELRARNVIVAAGHSDASVAEAERAVAQGVSLVTNIFDSLARRPVQDPGTAGLLGSGASSCTRPYYTVVADNLHVHPTMLKMAHSAHPGGAVLVTGATAAMGLEPGTHQLGDAVVRVLDDRVLLNGANILAGNVAPMDVCVRNYRDAVGSTAAALNACTLHPARALGIADKKGTLNEGADADFVLLDDDLQVKATYLRGELVWVTPAAGGKGAAQK